MRALKREPAPPGPQLAAPRNFGLVCGHSVVDSSYSVFQGPSGRLVIIDREVAALCIEVRAAGPGKQRVTGAQVEGEATNLAVPLGGEYDAALSQFVACGVQVAANAVLAARQPVLGPVGDLQGHQVVVERIGTGVNHGAEPGRLVVPQLLSRLVAATLAEAGQVALPRRVGQFEHALG